MNSFAGYVVTGLIIIALGLALLFAAVLVGAILFVFATALSGVFAA